MSGHEGVKAGLVDHLRDRLGPWLTVAQAPAPKYVDAGEWLPEKDERWPCVLVTSSRLLDLEHDGEGGYVGIYDVEIRVAVRASRDDRAVQGRDRLMLAVRWLFLGEPDYGSGAVEAEGITEETLAAVPDGKGRPVAAGSVSFRVSQFETGPVPGGDPVEVSEALVAVFPTAAGDPLPSDYDSMAGYNAPSFN